MNDLHEAVPEINVQLYADDTVLYTSSPDTVVLVNDLQQGLDSLSKWCNSNKLTVNPKKTKMMTFGTRSSVKKTKGCKLYLDNTRIQAVATFKYLGFVLDSTLSFKNQISDIIKKVFHKHTLLTRLMSFLNVNTTLLIYKTMLLPYFDYCDVVYQQANSGDLEKLQRLQNKCLKTSLGLNKRCDTKTVHTRAKCAMLEARRKAHLCNFMFIRQGRINLMDERDIRTRQHDAPLFLVNIPHNEAFKRSVQYSGSVTWNNLSVETRSLDNYQLFKFHQKRSMSTSTK